MQKYRIVLLSVLLAIAFFVGDLLVPMDIAGGVLYVVAVLVTMWAANRRLTDLVALLCTVFLFVGYMVGPDTSNLWVDVTNRILGLLAVWLTAALVSERRRAEEELRHSEAKTRSILNATADGIVSLDSDDRIETYNPAVRKIFGIGDHELMDRSIAELTDGASSLDLQNYLRSVRQSRANGEGTEILGRRADGSTFPMHVTLTPSIVDGRPQITGVLRDLSQQRRLEQEVMRISELERRQIGHQLHEGLGQMLTGIGLITRSLHQKLLATENPHAEEAAQIIQFLKEADEYARDLSLGLVPLQQDDTGLSYALQRLVASAKDRFGVECKFVHLGIPVNFDDPLTAAHFYQIAQDALTFLVQSPKPKRIRICLIGAKSQARLTIEYEGGAHESEDVTWERVLSFRSRLIGASLKSERTGSGGFISCTLPLERLEPSVAT